MLTGVTTVRGLSIDDAIAGRSRAMVDEGSDKLYIKISMNTVRRVTKAQGWSSIGDITYTSVSEALYAIREAGRTKKTRDNTLAVLSELMEWCVKNGHASENPCKLIERVHARGEIETDAPRALEWDVAERWEDVAREREQASIEAGKTEARRADLLRVLRFTGRRPGEWVPLTVGGKKDDAIRVRDVKFDTAPFPTFVVRSTVNKSRRKLVLPMHPAIVDTLRAACAGKHPEDYVFSTQPETETIDADLAAAGIDKLTSDGVATLYSLRHTFNTTLAVHGVNLTERKLLMGHAVDQDLTDGTYLDKNILQSKLYTAVQKLPWSKCTKSAQEHLTCAGSMGDTEGVTSQTSSSRHCERRPATDGTSHLAVVGRPSLSRENPGISSCAAGRRSFDDAALKCPPKDSNLRGPSQNPNGAQDRSFAGLPDLTPPPDGAGACGVALSIPCVAASALCEAGAASSDHDAASAAIDALTEAVRSHHIQRSPLPMRVKIAALVAATVGLVAAPVSSIVQSIESGFKCAVRFGCLNFPDPIDQFTCCSTHCAATQQQLHECFDSVMGVPDPDDTLSDRIIDHVRADCLRIRFEMADPEFSVVALADDISNTVDVMIAVAAWGDDREARAMTMLAGTFGQAGHNIIAAYEGRAPHTEQGEVRTGTRKRTA